MYLLKYKLLKKTIQVKKFIKKLSIEQIITYLQVFAFSLLALVLVVIIWNVVLGNSEKILGLIAALAILISALLASYSVMLNIDTTIKFKNREHSNLVRNVFFQLCLIKMRLIGLNNEKDREKITYMDIDRIFDTVEDIHNLLLNLKTQEIVTITHNSVLSDIHFVYLEITTLHTHLKAMRKNLIKPDVSKNTQAIFPNIMKTDFRLEIAIKRLTSTLTYLQNGYEKDFPKNTGIEQCADYSYEAMQQKHKGIS